MPSLQKYFPDTEGLMWPQRATSQEGDFDDDYSAIWVKHVEAQAQIDALEQKNAELVEQVEALKQKAGAALKHMDNLRKVNSMHIKGYVTIDECIFIDQIMEDDAKFILENSLQSEEGDKAA